MGVEYKKQQVGKITLFVLCMVFFFFSIWIASNVPYGRDDWAWGTEVGMEQFLTASLNSRYSGNLLEIILTRFVFLKNLIMGLSFFLIAFLPLHLAGGRELYKNRPWDCAACFCLSASFVLATPSDIWRQTFGWVAGFSNFVFPMVLLSLLIIIIVGLLGPQRDTRSSPTKAALLFLLTVVLQMFIENLTVYIMGVAIVLFILDWILNSRPSLCFGAFLIGAILGTMLMFSSNIYGTLLNTGEAVDGYRRLMFEKKSGLTGIVFSIIQSFLHRILPFIWGNDQPLGLAILSLMLVLLVSERVKFPKGLYNKLLILHILTLIIWGIYCLGFLPDYMLAYNVYWNYATPPASMPQIYQLHYIVELLYILIILMETVFIFRGDKAKMWLLLILWVSPPLVVLPLAAVNSIGYRSFFTSNYFMLIFCVQIMFTVIDNLSPRWKAVLTALPLCALVALYIRLSVVYSAIGSFSKAQMKMIEEAKAGQRSELVFEFYPYTEYLWSVEPTDERSKGEFKEFYGIPENVTISYP